jgi:polysaccharide export outer membrane protein
MIAMKKIILPNILLMLFALTGCSSTSSSPFGMPTSQHRLLPEAKAFREVGTPPSGPRELAKALHPAHVLEPSDVLLVTVADLDSPIRIPADQPILPDGTIDLGKYGRPVVAGKTVPEAEAEIIQSVRRIEKDASGIQVRLLNRLSKVYYVLGEVNAPGAFPVTGRETALDGIIAAGGLTRRASEGKILISRPTMPEGCRIVLPVCYPQIVQLGDTTTNYQLQAGDRIYVSSKTWQEELFPCFNTKPTCACSTPQMPCAGCGPTLP